MANHRRNVDPVAPRKSVDASAQPIGQPGTVTMPITGEPELVRPEIQVVDGPTWPEKAALLAFMEEPVTVMVHQTKDRFAKPIVEVWNDGIPQRFVRGQVQTVKRKYVEVLARAKPVAYSNEEFRDHEGNQQFRYNASAGLEYPFDVIEDTAQGRAWLRKILAEAA